MSVHYVIGVFVIAITVYCLAITRLRWDNLKLIKKNLRGAIWRAAYILLFGISFHW